MLFYSVLCFILYILIYRCSWRETTVAVKQLYNVTEKSLLEFRAEASVYIRIRPHPNVVLFIGITSPPDPITVMLYLYLHLLVLLLSIGSFNYIYIYLFSWLIDRYGIC